MFLSSYNRLIRYLSRGDNAMTDNEKNRRDILVWLPAVSAQIERYLNRSLTIESRTEYFDVNFNTKEFFPAAIPIISVTSLYMDSSGKFDGSSESEIESDDYVIGVEDRSIIYPFGFGWTARRSVRLIYTAGLAYDGVKSTYAITISSGSFATGTYCIGESSGAVGLITTGGATSIIVEVLYGKFLAGETLHSHTTEAATESESGVAVLDTKTREALCESYPEITTACEIQTRYMWHNKMGFENIGTQQNGESTRRGVSSDFEFLQPEAIAMLQMLSRKVV